MPLYFVVAAGSLAFVVDGAAGPGAAATATHPATAPPRCWLERLLAGYVVLYALQATYSPKFTTALQQMVFFYVPFALAYCLLRRLDWTPRLIRICLLLLAGLAVLFALVGFVEYDTKTIFLNPKLVASNAVHTYFTVNSVFLDPNIFGRFLALVMILVAAVLLYARRQRTQVASIAVLAILWAALVLTVSRSSIGALLVGLGALGAIRWNVGRAVFAAAGVVALAAAAIALSPTTFGLNQGLNGASSGRPGLVSGGLDLFADRAHLGIRIGVVRDRVQRPQPRTSARRLSASHTIPITIAAEQGLIGELVYVALVIAALVTLFRRCRRDPARVAIACCLPRPAVPHDALRRLPRGSDHLDAAGDRSSARAARRRRIEPGGEVSSPLATASFSSSSRSRALARRRVADVVAVAQPRRAYRWMSLSSAASVSYCPVCTNTTLPAGLRKIVVGKPSSTASEDRSVEATG